MKYLRNFFKKNFLKIEKLFRDNFVMSEYSTIALAIMGTVGHPIYWFWWTFIDTQSESPVLRLIGTISCFLLFFKNYWKIHFPRLFPFYWFFVVTFNFPFIFSSLLIVNKFSLTWSMAEVAAIFFVISLFRSLILFSFSILIGVGSAFLIFYSFNEQILNTHTVLFVYAPIFLFVLSAGTLFNFSGTISIIKNQREKIFKSLLGSIAHELRNPLNAINLATTQLQPIVDSLDDSNPKTHGLKKEIIDLDTIISFSLKQANNIINIILADLNEKVISKDGLKTISAKEIISEIVNSFGYNSQEQKLKVKNTINDNNNFYLKADENRFIFIIYNLLKNSLYYLNEFPNSIITIGTEIRTLNNKQFNIIFVHDLGPGIPRDIIPKLFDDFFTLGKEDGTGLGLAFCKRNMQIFEGDIICESEFGGVDEDGKKKSGWTKFSLLFPVMSDVDLNKNNILNTSIDQSSIINENRETNTLNIMQNTTEIVKKEPEIKAKKILIVDDQQVNLMVFKRRFKNTFQTIEVDIANNANEAVRFVKQNAYELILMDIQMPEIDGIAATKLIREFDNKTPISAFTTLSKKEFKKELNLPILNTGFNDYLYKELSANLLFRSVGKWISGFQNNFQFVEVPDGYKKLIEGKRVLLADDQEFNLELTKKFLENNGLKITKVNNGKELVDLFKENSSNFDLIITDIKMPIVSGDEASLMIRDFENLIQIDNYKYIPIIALSGDGEKNDISKFFKSEINDFFVKGDSPENLLKLIYIYTSS